MPIPKIYYIFAIGSMIYLFITFAKWVIKGIDWVITPEKTKEKINFKLPKIKEEY